MGSLGDFGVADFGDRNKFASPLKNDGLSVEAVRPGVALLGPELEVRSWQDPYHFRLKLQEMLRHTIGVTSDVFSMGGIDLDNWLP